MNRKQRKETLQLIANGGILDTIGKGIEEGVNYISNFDAKKTIREIFNQSKEKPTEAVSSPTQSEIKATVDKVKQKAEEESPAVTTSTTTTEPAKKPEGFWEGIVNEIKDLVNFNKEQDDRQKETKVPAQLAGKVKGTLQGYQRASYPLPSNAHEEAEKMLSFPMGSTKSIKLNDGKWYIAVVEEHFDNHPKGSGEPYKHKGVSLFSPISGVGEDRGQFIA